MTKAIFKSVALLFFIIPALAYAQSSAPGAPGSKTVEIFGQKIYYVESGSDTNPTVILLHGLGGDVSNWAATTPAISGKYHVFAMDQIGFGQSDKPIINYRVGTLVEFLNAFYKKLGIEKATLVGNSLGGWTAAAFAIAYPAKVEKLVLVDAAGYTPERWGGPKITREALLRLNPSTPSGMKEMMSVVLANKTFLTDPVIEQMFAAKLKRGDGYTINSFIESFLLGEDGLDGKTKTIKSPTLVAWGKEDGLTPLAIGKAFAEDIPGAQLVVFENCGHVPQIEKASEFNAALLKFLGGAAGAATSSK
jgi:pimeloyl-ACP methyl ester carboxylesterase